MSVNQPTATMPSEDVAQRTSAGSGRSSGSRSKQNPQQQLSTIEKSVTHLLVATKQLLETLTMWSTGRATEAEVSDVYVRLGYEFNIACRAFNAIGVDTSDLGPVPDMLRTILEETLSQEASQQSLEKYLPRIRDIIINLLHGLKKKQQRLRQKGGKDGDPSRPTRQMSTASSVDSALTQQLDEIPTRQSSSRSFLARQTSGEIGLHELPPRTTSVTGRVSPRRAEFSPQNSYSNQPRDAERSDSGSSLSSNAMNNIPVIAPYPDEETMPTNQGLDQDQLSLGVPRPPKANDALSALQRGGDLERRASRRFSAYQIQKHLGTSLTGISAIPAAQNSPIPNRGRDVRESMVAVRSRGSVMHGRARSRNQPGAEAAQNGNHVERISEEPSSQHLLEPPDKPFANENQPESPIPKTPDDKVGGFNFTSEDAVGATVKGPLDEPFAHDNDSSAVEAQPTPGTERVGTARQAKDHTPPVSQYVPEGSPQAGRELTLFLQYKSKIKKYVLSDGGDLSIPRLQLAFIEKFAWNTHNNGVDLPEIYIQDPVSGVRHELEDLSDVKERSVLVLNVEALDEVKRHFDDGIGGIRRIVEGIRVSVEDQQSALQRVSDRQQETAKELAGLAAAPPSASVVSTPSGLGSMPLSGRAKSDQMKEVQSLRRDLAVVRQTYKTFVSDVNASMATLRTKAAGVKKAAVDSQIPEMDNNSGRAYVNNGKKSLTNDSERIVNRVDDLQDLVEDLRKDVVTRGVRPLPRQLESVSKDISIVTADLKKMQEFLKKEKPIWTKIWEKELQVVCDDRDLLTMQEELVTDLEDDLEKAAATFALVEQATKQQNLQNPDGSGGPSGSRSTSRSLNPLAVDQGADPHKAKDGVLGEVRALQPNHESRLEAIERAERARQRELENRRGGEFQRELGHFVEEGKLKKSGGVEEVERVRKVREEKTRKEVYERQQQRLRDAADREAAITAAQAQAGTEIGVANGGPPEPLGWNSSTPNGLEVPGGGKNASKRRGSSPDPEFVEAKEEISTPSSETGP